MGNNMKDLTFTSMVCSKILHDLAGPIGAVMNGTELLEEGGVMLDQEEIIQLLKDSTDQLNANLQVFRIAYGAMSTGLGQVDVAMFCEAIEVYARFKAFPVMWEVEGVEVNKYLAKLVINVALIMADAVRKKGQMRISFRGEGNDLSFSVTGLGAGVKISGEVREVLEGKANLPYNTGNMSAYIARTLADDLKLSISVEEAPTGVTVSGSME